MANWPARFTVADLRRAVKVAQELGPDYCVEIEPDGVIRIALRPGRAPTAPAQPVEEEVTVFWRLPLPWREGYASDMPISYVPPPRTFILCDYGQGGFHWARDGEAPAGCGDLPRLPHRDNLCAVVPLSTTASGHPVPYAVRIELNPPLPAPFAEPICWAKCDLLATVALRRLDLFRTGRDHTGKRPYLTARLPEADFERIRAGILAGLGIGIGAVIGGLISALI